MITKENRKLLENLEEINFGDYRREVKADLMYGFLKQGDPAIWREESESKTSEQQSSNTFNTVSDSEMFSVTQS